MSVDPLAALRLILAAVADGRITVDEAADIIAALVPRDVVAGALESVAEAIDRLFRRSPERLRARAAKLSAEGEHERAAELLDLAAVVEARRA